MSRERDSQRKKVYIAEDAAMRWTSTPRSELMTIKECQAFIDKVMSSKWLRSQPDLAGRIAAIDKRGGVVVIAGRGRANATFDVRYSQSWGEVYRETRPSISAGTRTRQPYILLHELAHILDSSSGAWHGWQFCDILLRLVKHFMGAEAHARLKASFKEHKVRFTAPRAKRELTPEQRALLTQRLAAARAAKAVQS